MAANLLPTGTRVSDLAQLKAIIYDVCLWADRHLLDLMMELLDIPRGAHPKIQQRWVDAGSPSALSVFAPFSTHVFKVNLLYLLGVARGFISGERASNRADMAYLYYLPFCMVFTSGDGLHKRTAPLFLHERQRFIAAEALKAALAELDAHFDGLPDSVKQMGVMRFSSYPPSTLDNEVTKSWDQLMRPDWRVIAGRQEAEMLDPAYPDRPLGSAVEINAMHDASTAMTEAEAAGLGFEDADMVFVKKSMPLRRGKWSMLPPSFTDE